MKNIAAIFSVIVLLAFAHLCFSASQNQFEWNSGFCSNCGKGKWKIVVSNNESRHYVCNTCGKEIRIHNFH